jgi:hypothetical protein
MKQRKLSDAERQKVLIARDAICRMPPWIDLPAGERYWKEVYDTLRDMHRFGTNDGKPIEPQYRTPTDEDAKLRPMAEFRHRDDAEWTSAKLLAVVDGFVPFIGNTGFVTQAWGQCRIPITD